MRGACEEQQARVYQQRLREMQEESRGLSVLPLLSYPGTDWYLALAAASTCLHSPECVPVCDGTQMFRVSVLCPGPAQAETPASREQETNPSNPSFLWLQDKVGLTHWVLPSDLG